MMVTAMAPKNASWTRGIIPRMVVPATSSTGRRRATPAARMASYGVLPRPISRYSSSISTTEFLICSPPSDRTPSSAMNPNGSPVSNIPAVTPMIANGTVKQMIIVVRMELKRHTTMKTMANSTPGIDSASAARALPESSNSPPHSNA